MEAKLEALRAPGVEQVRRIRREASGKLTDASPRAVLALAGKLLDNGGWPERLTAYELVSHHPGELASLGPNELARLGKNLDSWAAVDRLRATCAVRPGERARFRMRWYTNGHVRRTDGAGAPRW